MFKANKPSKHFQEVYNCLARNSAEYIPMMSNQDLKEFATKVASNPLAVRFIIMAYRANMMILKAMYNFMKAKTKKNK